MALNCVSIAGVGITTKRCIYSINMFHCTPVQNCTCTTLKCSATVVYFRAIIRERIMQMHCTRTENLELK